MQAVVCAWGVSDGARIITTFKFAPETGRKCAPYVVAGVVECAKEPFPVDLAVFSVRAHVRCN